MLGRTLPALALFSAFASASLVRIEVSERSDVLEGKPFGAAGPYERIVARACFAADPALPASRIITDIGLAPRNEEGKVEFAADLYILKPRDAAKGNGTILFEVSNRGRKGLLRMFDFAETSNDPRARAHFGDGFLLGQGFTLVWLGWQFDVPDEPNLLRLFAPAARDGNRPITGPVRSEFVPDRKALSFPLGDRTMLAYPVADPQDPAVQLTVRERVDSSRRVIPRSLWQFARLENGSPVLDRTSVFLPSGFEPGKIYEVVYKAQDPVLVGLGPAAVRDLISFFKYGGTPAQGHVLMADHPKIPGVIFPSRIHKAYRVDYGPQFREAGIVSLEPPKVGKPFPVLVPQVDADGNETSGIRLPDVQAPLATYTGWNLRSPELGAPDELYSMVSSYLPFPANKAERARKRDPRPSIEERYRNRQEYLERVAAAARELARAGYLLQSDTPRLVEQAGRHWDHLVR